MHSSAKIDLVKSKSNLKDDILRWALSFGRFLVIVVEIIAFSAFIYRFALDKQIIELNDKIKEEQVVLLKNKDNENTFRNLQERLGTVKKITATGNSSLTILNDIISFTPPEITYNSISIDKGSLNLDLNITTFSSLTSYVNKLKEYPQINSIVITGIDNNSGENLVKVTLTGKIKEINE